MLKSASPDKALSLSGFINMSFNELNTGSGARTLERWMALQALGVGASQISRSAGKGTLNSKNEVSGLRVILKAT